MPDPIFADPRLAQVYDAFDGHRDDLGAYLRIVGELGARHVLDVGCGTGSFAVLLAQHGHQVTGMDPAAASLEIAKSKPGAGTVRWIHGYADALPAMAADAATMTGNVAQVFLTDEEWNATLTDIRAALRPGGHLVFETRRPEDRAWDAWARDPGPLIRVVPGIGEVEQRREVTSVALPYVTFRMIYTFADGSVVTSESRLRFRDRAEIEESLEGNGFKTVSVREAPDRPGREYVFVAERT